MDNNVVNKPAHYTDGKIEVIDFIEDKKLGFHLGNAVKYISRTGKKDPDKTVEDLQKAKWYLEREIKRQQGSEDKKITVNNYDQETSTLIKILTEIPKDNFPESLPKDKCLQGVELNMFEDFKYYVDCGTSKDCLNIYWKDQGVTHLKIK